jgi:hypothetical protein
MALRTTISAALDRRKARKQQRREDKELRQQKQKEVEERLARAYALTPQELAQRIATGELVGKRVARWARCVPSGDMSKLARDIAALSEQDRRMLALVADGWRLREIEASWLPGVPAGVFVKVRRIFVQLGADLKPRGHRAR